MRTRLLLLALLLGACRTEPAPPVEADASDPAPRETSPARPDTSLEADTLQHDEDEVASEPFEGTVRTTTKAAVGQGVALLEDVRIAQHEGSASGFDRVVFAFDGETLPGYTLEYVDRPVYNCGEGRAVPIEGDAWLRVQLTPANAHTEAGRPTVAPRERRPGLPVIREAKLTCDFEADVTWVLGLAAPNPYRILELRNPTRLVVDVRH